MTRPAWAALAAALVTALVPTAAARAADPVVTVRNPGDALGETPLLTAVETTLPEGAYALHPESGGSDLPARLIAFRGKTYLGVVLPSLPAKAAVRYRLTEAKGAASPGVTVEPEGNDLAVKTGGKLLTVYRRDLASKPYFYPVIGPGGAEVTRAYPIKTDRPGEKRDHPHQRSLWFTHGKVNGLDYWASDPLNKPSQTFGTIKETSSGTLSGPAVGAIHTTDDWLDHDGKKVCEDERIVVAYDTAGARVLDVDVTIKATGGPVTFGDTKEGMFGFRVASSMDVDRKEGGKITNAEGLNDAAAWGKASPWVDYTGPVGGKTLGIAILNHPDSFRFPTTWHVRTYGLFAANPFGWHDFGLKKSGEHVIPAGESIRFRYRVILHEGDTASAKLPDAFRAYAGPPAVEVTAGN